MLVTKQRQLYSLTSASATCRCCCWKRELPGPQILECCSQKLQSLHLKVVVLPLQSLLSIASGICVGRHEREAGEAWILWDDLTMQSLVASQVSVHRLYLQSRPAEQRPQSRQEIHQTQQTHQTGQRLLQSRYSGTQSC